MSGGILLPEPVKMPGPPHTIHEKVFHDGYGVEKHFVVDGQHFLTREAAHAYTLGMHATEGSARTRGRSLDEEQMELDAAKIERYMRFVQPTLQTIMPAMDRVERSSQDVSARVEALERSYRRTVGLLILANAAALALIFLSKYFPILLKG